VLPATESEPVRRLIASAAIRIACCSVAFGPFFACVRSLFKKMIWEVIDGNLRMFCVLQGSDPTFCYRVRCKIYISSIHLEIV
jgi:hypothetical protein